jgi:hypothetical protein
MASMSNVQRALPLAAGTCLVSIGAIHLAWAAGASWPAADRAQLADRMAGRPPEGMPGSLACVGVAALCCTAGALVAGGARRRTPARRIGVATVISVLSVRGVLGLAGRTDLVSPGSNSPRFRTLDRRIYSPLCLTIAAMAVPAAASRAKR